jgi:TP901 family phage tail tape measure protein
MATPFNLVAQITLRGPSQKQVNDVVIDIKKRLGRVTAPINLVLTGRGGAALTQLNTALNNINASLLAIRANTEATSQSMRKLGTTSVATSRAVTQGSNRGAQAVDKVGKSTQTAATEMAEFGRQSALAVRRFLAFSIPAGLLVGLVVGMRRGIGAAVEFEREMVKVSQVTGKNLSSLQDLQNEIKNLATTWGVSSAELVDVSRILSQAGFSANEAKVALEALALSDLAPTFDNMQQSAEGLIAVMQQFDIPVERANEVLSKMNAVAGAFAVESSDLISAIRRTGGAFQAAGGSIEELLALFTSVRSTTRESADSIATGFRTIFTRMQRPRTIAFLKEMDIELSNLEGQFVGPYEAIRRLHDGLKGLDPRDFRFAQVVEELGGFRQVSKVIPLLQQFAEAQKAMAVAMAGSDSLIKDAVKAQDTLVQKMKQVQEAWANFYREVVASPTFQLISNAALKLTKTLATLADTLLPVLQIVGTLASISLLKTGVEFGGGFFKGLHKLGPTATGAAIANTVTGGATSAALGGAAAGSAAAAAATSTKAHSLDVKSNTLALKALTKSLNAMIVQLGGTVPGGSMRNKLRNQPSMAGTYFVPSSYLSPVNTSGFSPQHAGRRIGDSLGGRHQFIPSSSLKPIRPLGQAHQAQPSMPGFGNLFGLSIIATALVGSLTDLDSGISKTLIAFTQLI